MWQVIQRGDDIPAVQLALIDLLGAVVKAGGIAKPDGVAGREQAECRMGLDDAILVQQGQPPLSLQYPLDNKHHIGPAGIIFIKYQGGRCLQRPGQNTFLELGDLSPLL